jgi:hypothetical protein
LFFLAGGLVFREEEKRTIRERNEQNGHAIEEERLCGGVYLGFGLDYTEKLN